MDSGRYIDLGVGVAQAGLGCYLSWKAFVATLKVPKKSEHPKHKGIFAFCCLAVIALTAVQTYRNFGLDSKLDKIESNTEKPPQVTVNIPPQPAPAPAPKHSSVEFDGEPSSSQRMGLPDLRYQLQAQAQPGVVFAFRNAGDFTVQQPADAGVAVLVPSAKMGTSFEDNRKSLRFGPSAGNLLPHSPNGAAYNTARGPTLTGDDVIKIKNGDLCLCAIGAVRWSDDTGKYETDFEYCLQSEPDHRSLNWHIMKETNVEHKLQ
jgi:hypothetical protein